MRQKITLLTKTMLLLCALVAGSGSTWAEDQWIETSATDLQTGDVVVIVDKTTGKALPNTVVAKGPSATSVTLNEDKDEISSEVASNLQWSVTVNDGAYQFTTVSDNTTYYLACKSDNNGVYVSNTVASTDASSFSIETDQNNNQADFLKAMVIKKNTTDTEETRYIGVYNSQDWRCYTTINNNIKNTVTTFYKKVTAQSSTWTVTYNANNATSGTVPTDNNSYDATASTVTVLGNSGNLTKTGYTFGGWNTKADGTGETYAAGDEFTISASTILYAKWVANTHTVTLPTEDEYGTYTMDATNPVGYDTEVTLTYTPESGYENYQATWSVNGTPISGNKFDMPDEDVTVTVSVEEVVDYATLPFSWAGGASSTFNALTGVTTYGLGSDYGSSHDIYLMKFDGTGDYIQVKTDGQPGKVTIGVKMIGGSSTSTITVQGSANGTDFTKVEDLSVSGSQNDILNLVTSNSFAATDRYVRLYFTKGSNVGVGNISIAKPSTDPVINADATVSLAADDTSGEIAYSITNPADGTNLTASKEAGCDWISDVTVEATKVTFTTTANTSSERSAIITLTYGSLTKEVTVTQADGTPVTTTTYTLATSVVPGRHYIIVGKKDNVYKAMGEQKDNNRAAVEITVNNNETSIASNAGVYEVLLGVDESGYFTFYDSENSGYLYAACGTGTGNYMKVETNLDEDGYGLWTITIAENGVATVKATNGGRNWMRYNYNSGNSIISCYGSGQQDIYLFERDGDTGAQDFTVNINSACTDGKKSYGTFSAPFAFTVPSDVTVSEIGVIDGELLVEDYEANAIIPANTGVMISSATAGDKTFTSAKGGTSALGDDNNLRPTYWGVSADDMSAADAGCLYYRLTMHNGSTIGFWWGAAEGAAFDLAANKAYLAVPTTDGARSGFSLFGESNGIGTVEHSLLSTDGEVYNLQGQRVDSPTKSLYIVNGKKVVMK